MKELTRRRLLAGSLAASAFGLFSTRTSAAAASAQIPWRNWSGGQIAHPTARFEPATEEALVKFMKASHGSLRPVGSGHSFSPLVPTDGHLVVIDRLAGLLDHDAATLQATFGAGTRLGDMGLPLEAFGQGMINLPDIDRQTLAGATSTATHGTGIGFNTLIDTHERLRQYAALARELGIEMRANLEIDVGLHRGGLPEPEALDPMLATLAADGKIELSGFMGYEPHLTAVQGGLEQPAVKEVLARYRDFVDRARSKVEVDIASLTLNGAGSHTLKIYERDRTMNDLSAGSAVVKPTDFDTFHLAAAQPALFIATPVLKRYEHAELPGGTPNNADGRRLYYIYGGYWMAKFVSPADVGDAPYHSTNQEPVITSADLAVDDYMFLRPTQSEHVMLQFGDLRVVQDGAIVNTWPVFHQTV